MNYYGRVMLTIARLILIGVFVFLSSFLILLVCIFRPRNVKNVWVAAQLYSKVSWLLGVKVTIVGKENIPSSNCVYVANHQSNYDIFLLTAAVPLGAVSIGKKSLLYFPIFGLIYWLSGNILIERGNKAKAVQALKRAKEKMLKDNVSVWLFPEGTRNYGRGLRPFKMGAFHLARSAELPLVPVSVSNYYPNFKLGRVRNGEIIIKFLQPIAKESVISVPISQTAASVYAKMDEEIAMLDKSLHPLKHDD